MRRVASCTASEATFHNDCRSLTSLPLSPVPLSPCGVHSYPLDPPSVSFLTPLYHPNVDERGRICLDTLSLPPKGRWSPAMTLAALLTTVHQLMAYPNGQDGLVREVADVFNSDREQFNRRAREMTAQHAVERKDEQRQGQGDEEESKQEKKEGGGQLTTDTSDGSAAAVASGSAKRERPTGGSEAGDGASGGGAADAEEEPDAKKSRLS